MNSPPSRPSKARVLACGDTALAVEFGTAIDADSNRRVFALDRALGELEAIDARAARVVQLHFFGGLTFPAIAELEGLNERTIKRDWQAARHLLAASMGAQPADRAP